MKRAGRRLACHRYSSLPNNTSRRGAPTHAPRLAVAPLHIWVVQRHPLPLSHRPCCPPGSCPQVILMEGEHALLLDRTRWRRIDPNTQRVYHCPEASAGALSPPVLPLGRDGNVDKDIMAR